MTIVATLRDGRVIASASITTIYPVASTATATSATIAELRKVEKVLSINLFATNNISITVTGTSVYSNVVGLTVVPGATGTTVTGEVIAIGY